MNNLYFKNKIVILWIVGMVFCIFLNGCNQKEAQLDEDNTTTSYGEYEEKCYYCGLTVDDEHWFESEYNFEVYHDYCFAKIASYTPNIVNILGDANGEALNHLFAFAEECGYYPSVVYGDYFIEFPSRAIHCTDSPCLKFVEKDNICSGLQYGVIGYPNKIEIIEQLGKEKLEGCSFCDRCCPDETTNLSYWAVESGSGTIVYSELFIDGEMEYDEYHECIWDFYCDLHHISLYDDKNSEVYRNDKIIRDYINDIYEIDVSNEDGMNQLGNRIKELDDFIDQFEEWK